MARVLNLREAAECAECGARLEPGDKGRCYPKRGGRRGEWDVYGVDCHVKPDGTLQRGSTEEGRRAVAERNGRVPAGEAEPVDGPYPDRHQAAAARGVPEEGKTYRLTGTADQPSVARGDTWAESVVPEHQGEPDVQESRPGVPWCVREREKVEKAQAGLKAAVEELEAVERTLAGVLVEHETLRATLVERDERVKDLEDRVRFLVGAGGEERPAVERIESYQTAIEQVKAERDSLRGELDHVKRLSEQYRGTIDDLDGELDELKELVADQKERIRVLESEEGPADRPRRKTKTRAKRKTSKKKRASATGSGRGLAARAGGGDFTTVL